MAASRRGKAVQCTVKAAKRTNLGGTSICNSQEASATRHYDLSQSTKNKNRSVQVKTCPAVDRKRWQVAEKINVQCLKIDTTAHEPNTMMPMALQVQPETESSAQEELWDQPSYAKDHLLLRSLLHSIVEPPSP